MVAAVAVPIVVATGLLRQRQCGLYGANPVHHRCTKHIEIDIHFVREVALGKVRVLHVPSSHQFADIITKGLLVQLFTDFRSSLASGILPLRLQAVLGFV